MSLQFNTDPEDLWGTPDLEAWLPEVVELNKYRRKRMEKIEKNISKILGDKEALNPEAITALKSLIESDIVPVDLEDKSIEKIFKRIDPSGTPPDVHVSEARAKEDLANISGLSQQRRGVSGTYLTATEASIIEVASRDFEGDRLNQVSELQENMAIALLSLTRQYKSRDEIVRTGGLDAYSWYTVTPEMRQFPYDIEIVIGSSKFISEEEDIDRHVAFFNLVSQLPVTDIVELAKAIGDKMAINTNRFLIDPRDPEGLQRMALLATVREIMGIQLPQGGANGGGGVAGALQNMRIGGGQTGGSVPQAVGTPEQLAGAAGE